MGTRLTKWQIAAEHRHPDIAEFLRQRDQQRRLAVCPGAVGQDQTSTRGIRRKVQEAANRSYAGIVAEWPDFRGDFHVVVI